MGIINSVQITGMVSHLCLFRKYMFVNGSTPDQWSTSIVGLMVLIRNGVSLFEKYETLFRCFGCEIMSKSPLKNKDPILSWRIECGLNDFPFKRM